MRWMRVGAGRRRARVIGTLAGAALAVSGVAAVVVVLAKHQPAHPRSAAAALSAVLTPNAVPASTDDSTAVGQREVAEFAFRLADVRRDDGARTSRAAGSSPRRVEEYSLLQMNLCLSGMADCFDDTQYPKVVEEAIGVIAARKPHAVTFNEACRGDIARVARETGYHARFAAVTHRGRPLRCVGPRGRGVFGNAVITRAPITGSAERAFAAQVAGSEQRRWICVQTVRRVSTCTTHLSTRGTPAARAASREQCDELAAVLAARAERGPVVAAGDINRRHGCAPKRMWTRTDRSATQKPGVQHVYGSARRLAPTQTTTLPARYTDHDFLLVETRFAAPAAGTR